MMATFRAIEVRDRPKARKRERAMRPNAGIEADYRVKVDKMLREMHRSIGYWIAAKYRQNEPLIAQDESKTTRFRVGNDSGVTFLPPTLAFDEIPANELRKAMRALSKRWLGQFDDLAPALAKYFSLSVKKRTDAMLQKILRDGGFTVRFTMTRAMRDIVNATTAQNVALIKSIPEQYLKSVEGAVMRSVQTGRDLGSLTKELEKSFGVSHRRAALIARDQNQKATSAMTRARQTELGITTAKWRHSGGGRKPRPQHVAMNGKTYDVAKGMFDPVEKRHVFPGELVNCRCVSIPIIPGLD